jgi:hypothetical protein
MRKPHGSNEIRFHSPKLSDFRHIYRLPLTKGGRIKWRTATSDPPASSNNIRVSAASGTGSHEINGTGSPSYQDIDPNGYLDRPAPDDSQTWLLLAGVCAAFGAHEALNRRRVKVA